MKKLLVRVSLSIALSFAAQSATAQINLRLPEFPRLPKSNKSKSEQPKRENQTLSEQSGGPTATDHVASNPKAPPDYDAGLKVNDMATVKGFLGEINEARIVAKGGGAYHVVQPKYGSERMWFKANSVYPYFQTELFKEISYDRKNAALIEPYIECFKQKHKLTEEQVGRGRMPSFSTVAELDKKLRATLPQLAELEAKLKQIQAHPNTYQNSDDNPAIWWDIVSNREQYLQCAVAFARRERASDMLNFTASQIEAAVQELETFTPGGASFSTDTNDYVHAAVSREARAKWLKDKNVTDLQADFDPLFDKLAAVASRKLPLYLPKISAFKFRDPVAEKIMMAYFLPNRNKFHHIGIASAGWQIQKDNNDLLIRYRFKEGVVYFRDTLSDHPYCYLRTIRVKQDYAGGGTYSTNTYYGNTIMEIVGCPAGVK
jgi:hypothetical protein